MPNQYQPSVPCFLNVGGGAKGWHNNRAFSFPWLQFKSAILLNMFQCASYFI